MVTNEIGDNSMDPTKRDNFNNTGSTRSSGYDPFSNYEPIHIKLSRQQRRLIERILRDKMTSEHEKESRINKVKKQNEIKK